ncbi:hypothetical protein [Celeribacter indicus]|uniref:Uncharacterized protein n=1 Tax=Celeribacter indicus TaxID=1208324 RepID=A0A0B5E2F2_9RHOB|nr:hypothetical protein [Celeribacter indicus]AJE47191.1 hypothetical protein P73_2476 [Celeribacter indicus]SDW00370.1 hypothetical protein SAMN05443573_10124 [Celeribacter indicus]
MATYPLDFLSDELGLEAVTFDVQRNEEMHGTGDGAVWRTELARPLWKITVSLHLRHAELGRAIDAKLLGMGAGDDFLFADPSYHGPAWGPGSYLLHDMTVCLSGVSEDRRSVSLTGLGSNFLLSAGDRFSIEYGAGKVYFGVFRESRSIASSADAAEIQVFPYLPLGIPVGAELELVKPFLKVMLARDGYMPFTVRPGLYAESASITMLQKVR